MWRIFKYKVVKIKWKLNNKYYKSCQVQFFKEVSWGNLDNKANIWMVGTGD